MTSDQAGQLLTQMQLVVNQGHVLAMTSLLCFGALLYVCYRGAR